MEFKQSETKENLMRAFAGESQARNRYTFAAEQAKQENLHILEAVFTFTAEQEREHAKIFYEHLQELAGETVELEGSYPVDLSASLLDLLRAAQHNEYEEFDPVYRAFGDKALEEGFPKVAASFHQIAEIEKMHGDRFGWLADRLERNELFLQRAECKWMCLNCGFVYDGAEAPRKCPVCDHDRGYFIRLEFAPYTTGA